LGLFAFTVSLDWTGRQPLAASRCCFTPADDGVSGAGRPPPAAGRGWTTFSPPQQPGRALRADRLWLRAFARSRSGAGRWLIWLGKSTSACRSRRRRAYDPQPGAGVKVLPETMPAAGPALVPLPRKRSLSRWFAGLQAGVRQPIWVRRIVRGFCLFILALRRFTAVLVLYFNSLSGWARFGHRLSCRGVRSPPLGVQAALIGPLCSALRRKGRPSPCRACCISRLPVVVPLEPPRPTPSRCVHSRGQSCGLRHRLCHSCLRSLVSRPASMASGQGAAARASRVLQSLGSFNRGTPAGRKWPIERLLASEKVRSGWARPCWGILALLVASSIPAEPGGI